MSTADSFSATYQLVASSRDEAERTASNLCIEQSVEMPLDAVPVHVRNSIATLKSLNQTEEGIWTANVSYPKLLVDGDRTQFLNVLFGNSSIQQNVKLIDVENSYLNEILPGPSFGISGIRKGLNVNDRPLSCTALKPVGLSPSDLAERAYQFSRGGIDIIKDDHGLANQGSASFYSRVASCVRAVKKGEDISGKRTLYFPNITCSPSKVIERYKTAHDLGADGVVISPQLSGLEILSELAKIGEIPLMAHPAFSGSFVIHSNQGISAAFYYGKLWRSFGADAVIYPNAGGRFSFTIDECKDINNSCRSEIGVFNKSFPTPGGGINRDSVNHWMKQYGNDTIFLIGGSLYQHSGGIEASTKEFQQNLKNYE